MATAPLRFEVLVERHHDEIYGYLWRLLGGTARYDEVVDAQDLTQEVFARAYRAYTRLQPDSNVRAWLFKIATNCAFTALAFRRRQNNRLPASVEDVDGVTGAGRHSPYRQMVLDETLEHVWRIIATLPPKQQAAVILRHVQGLGYPDIAQALACSEESARANVYQATRRLRRELGAAVAEVLSE
jgi:RNA polymerase sigma-70 factor, ECF subfamily